LAVLRKITPNPDNLALPQKGKIINLLEKNKLQPVLIIVNRVFALCRNFYLTQSLIQQQAVWLHLLTAVPKH